MNEHCIECGNKLFNELKGKLFNSEKFNELRPCSHLHAIMHGTNLELQIEDGSYCSADCIYIGNGIITSD